MEGSKTLLLCIWTARVAMKSSTIIYKRKKKKGESWGAVHTWAALLAPVRVTFLLDTDFGEPVWNFPRIHTEISPQLWSIAGILGTTNKLYGSPLTLSPNGSARTDHEMKPSATNDRSPRDLSLDRKWLELREFDASVPEQDCPFTRGSSWRNDRTGAHI